jgi:virulence factor Mce-like protein
MSTNTLRRTALAVAALLVVVLIGASMLHHGKQPITVTADFSRTTGLYQENDVTMLGVPIGRVTSIKPDGPVVHVTMEVDGDVPIPANAGAIIMQRSLVTDRYVELTPSYDTGERLADGAHLPLARTRSPIGADDVLASMNRLLSALDTVGKANLSDLLHATAQNFDGNGAAIARVIEGVRKLARTGAASSADLTSIVTGLDQLSVALTKRDTLVNRFSTDLTAVTVQFAHDRKVFGSTIKELSTSLRLLAAFVTDNQQELGADVQRIAVLAAAMRKHERQLASVLRVTPQAYINVSASVNKDGQLYVNANATEFLNNPQLLSAFCQGVLEVLCAPTGGTPLPTPGDGTVPLSLSSLLGGGQ